MGIISGLGSFRGQFGDHFRVGDHFGVGIISGAVQRSQFFSQVKSNLKRTEFITTKKQNQFSSHWHLNHSYNYIHTSLRLPSTGFFSHNVKRNENLYMVI